MPRIEALMEQIAAEAGPTADDALFIRSQVLAFHADLKRLFDREENGLFPMLWRLEKATVLSRCHAGMVRSRVRFAIIEQEPLTGSLNRLKEATRACPAAACRGVLQLIEQFETALAAHLQRERQSLFHRAVEMEADLAARCFTAEASPTPPPASAFAEQTPSANTSLPPGGGR